MTDIIVTLEQMPWCEPPVRDMENEWKACDIEILKMAARGELLDADGNPISACRSYNGVTTYYGLDLFGELVEVK